MNESLATRQFFPIQTDHLMDNTNSPFDVYMLVEKTMEEASDRDYVVYAKSPYKWTLRELNDLLKSGIDKLYVEVNQRTEFERYKAMQSIKLEIDNSLEPKFRIREIQDVAAHLIEACMLSEINLDLTKALHQTAKSMAACIAEDPRSIFYIKTLCEHSIYTYIHSAGVAALASAIAMTMGEKDQDMLALYALSGLLHDIGKKDVPTSILNKSGPLTPEEWAIMRSHPEKGVIALDGLELAPMIIDVVGMHHEKLDGSGYSNGVGGNDIPDWTKIITVADIFSALTTSRCYHFKRSRFEALMFMKHEMRNKISKDAFDALVSSLVLSETNAKIEV